MNDETITLQHAIGHFHLARPAMGKIHRDHSGFGRETDCLELDVFAVNETLAQILEREGETKSGEGLARLHLNFFGPILQFILLALLRRGDL